MTLWDCVYTFMYALLLSVHIRVGYIQHLLLFCKEKENMVRKKYCYFGECLCLHQTRHVGLFCDVSSQSE